MAGAEPEANHVLILWHPDSPAGIRPEVDREIREVFGPLTKKGAHDLGETLHRLTGVPYEVVPMSPSPLQLTIAGQRAANRQTGTT